MEGIVEHFRSERDALRRKLQEVEEQLAQANLQVLKLTGDVGALKGSNSLLLSEVETVKKLSSNWEADNERLRADLAQQREDNQVLRERIEEKQEMSSAAPSRRRSPSLEIVEISALLHGRGTPVGRRGLAVSAGETVLKNTSAGSGSPKSPATATGTAKVIEPVSKHDVDMEDSEYLAARNSKPLRDEEVKPEGDSKPSLPPPTATQDEVLPATSNQGQEDTNSHPKPGSSPDLAAQGPSSPKSDSTAPKQLARGDPVTLLAKPGVEMGDSKALLGISTTPFNNRTTPAERLTYSPEPGADRKTLPPHVDDPSPSTANAPPVPSPTPKRLREGSSEPSGAAVEPPSKRRKRSLLALRNSSALSGSPLTSVADSEPCTSVPPTSRASEEQKQEHASNATRAAAVQPSPASRSSATQNQPADPLPKEEVKVAQPRKEEEEEEEEEAELPLGQANVDVKPKAEAISLPPSTVNAYLSSTPALTIKPPASCPAVSRDFMRLAYGGSNQQFVQTVKADRNVSSSPTPRIRRIVWPMLTMNPSMPRYPGAPGLVWASRHDITHDGPWTVFCPDVTNRKQRRWFYLGEYECEVAGQLTAEEFSSQGPRVKEEWGQLLESQKTVEAYTQMRVRITLRKNGKIPSGDPQKDATEATTGSRADKKDIIRAFERGEERIDIIRMRCVSYDHVFANDMIAKLGAEEPKPDPRQAGKDAKKAALSSAKGKRMVVEAKDGGLDIKDRAPPRPSAGSTATSSSGAGPGPSPATISSLRRSNRARVSASASFKIVAKGSPDDSSDSDDKSATSGDDFDYIGMVENRRKGKGASKPRRRNPGTTAFAPSASTSSSRTGSASQEIVEIFSNSEAESMD